MHRIHRFINTARRRFRKALLPHRDQAIAYAPLTVFVALIVMKVWIVRGMGLETWNPFSAIVLEGGLALLLFSAIGYHSPRGARLWLYFAADAVLSLLLAGTQIYIRQFELIPTAEAMAFAGQMGAVPQSVYALFRPRYWIFFADLFVILPALIVVAPLRHMGPKRHSRRLRNALIIGSVWSAAILVLLASTGPIADGMAGSREKGLLAYQSGYSALVPFNVLKDREKTAEKAKDPQADVATIQARINELQGLSSIVRVKGAPKSGIAKGRNVIIIQAESLQTAMVGATIGTRTVTPTLNALVAQSWYVPRMYTQVGKGNTSDAEFIANASAMGRKGKAASVAWHDKAIPAMPSLLATRGYQTDTFHANDVTFWNRDQLYPMLGFQKYWDKAYFGEDDVLGLGASDEVLFRMGLPVLRDYDASKRNYYAQFITLTSHHPFWRAAELSDFPLPLELDGTMAGDYVRAINYLDRQLGVFIEQLQRDGLWDDTVFIVYGDHFGIKQRDLTEPQAALLASLVGHEYGPSDHFQIPFIMHLPGQSKAGRIDSVMGQMDIMPTIADVMGVDLSQTVHFGVSAFDGGSRLVPIRYYTPEGTFVTDDYYFRPGIGFEDGEAWDVATGTKRADGASRKTYEKALEMSQLCSDYLDSLPRRPDASESWR